MAKFVPIGGGEYLNIDTISRYIVKGNQTQIFFNNAAVHSMPRTIEGDLNEIIEDYEES